MKLPQKFLRLIAVSFLIFNALFLFPVFAKADGDLTVEVYDVLGQNNAPELPEGAVPIYQGTTDDLAHNFDEEPLGGITEDFIVKYQGVISTPQDSNVLFMAQADDGVRLYINNHLIIDDWFDKGGGGSISAPQQFTANTPYEITLWYYENGGAAWLQTWWEVNYQWEIIPASAFGVPVVNPMPNPVPVEPSPEPSVVEPEPSPSPTPEPTPVDEQTPVSNPDPAPQPVPVEQPSPQPLPTPPPVAEPEPTPAPQPEPEPEPQPEPIPEPPAPQPEPEPVPVEPAPEPAPTPPVEEVAAPQVPEPAPELPSEPPTVEPEPPAVATEDSTPEEREAIAATLIEDANGKPVTAEAILAAGLTYEDLPPQTPVEVRKDENGNEVVITAEVAAALVVLENPAALVQALFTDPGQALLALASIGADMSDEERAESEKIIVASVIAGQAAVTAAAGAAGAAATYRRKL